MSRGRAEETIQSIQIVKYARGSYEVKGASCIGRKGEKHDQLAYLTKKVYTPMGFLKLLRSRRHVDPFSRLFSMYVMQQEGEEAEQRVSWWLWREASEQVGRIGHRSLVRSNGSKMVLRVTNKAYRVIIGACNSLHYHCPLAWIAGSGR
jgi:hypothetical protein